MTNETGWPNVLDVEEELVDRQQVNENTVWLVSDKIVTRSTEIAPGKTLIGLELSNLHDGMKIPDQLWEPLFGGERLKKELWDKLLVEPGDELIIKGSSVTKLLFAGYVYDTQLQIAADGFRGDGDAEIYQQKVLERVKTLPGKARTVGTRVEIGNEAWDLVDQGKIRQKLADELWILERQTADSEFDMVHSFAQDSRIRIEHDQSPYNQLLYNTYSRHESLAIVLKREADGTLSANLLDQLGSLQEVSLSTGTVNGQRAIQKELGEYLGVIFRTPTQVGVYDTYMMAAEQMETILYEDIAIPFYTCANITRVVRAACELNVEQNGSPSGGNFSGHRYYESLYNLAYRMSHDLNPFAKINEPVEKSQQELAEKLHREFQKDFARAAFADLNKAYWYMLAYLPLEKYISEDLVETFETMQRSLPVNNDLEFQLELDGIDATNLKLDAPGAEGILVLLRAKELVKQYYGTRIVEMQPLIEEPEKPLNYYSTARPPASMNEVMGVLFIAANWDPEKDADKIQRAVDNWHTSGKLNLNWKTHANMEFDTGLDKHGIIEAMRVLKDYSTTKPVESPSL